MPHALRSFTFVAAVATAAFLVGCPVPIPPLGYEASSRGNVPGERPAWLVDGRTSREDVLLRLGTPDAEARDGSWIGYLSSRHEGGIALVVPAGSGGYFAASSYTERRLVVWLDDSGIVRKAEFAQKECPRAGFGAGATTTESEPCMSFADLEGFPGIRAGVAGPAVGTPIGSFGDVVWSTPFFDWKSGVAPPGWAAYRGPVIVTATALVASGNKIGSGTAGHIRLEFSEMGDITRFVMPLWGHPALVVTMASGVEYQLFGVQSGVLGLNDRETTERLIKLVENALQRPARAR
jgi:hypothetical protein